jgi:hypothetical protein
VSIYRCIDLKPTPDGAGNLVTVEVEWVAGKPMRFMVVVPDALPGRAIAPDAFAQFCVAARQFGMTLVQIKAIPVTIADKIGEVA